MGAGARKHQLSATAPRASKAKPGVPGNDNSDPFKWKLLIDREGLCSLTANGPTLHYITNQIETYSNATVTAIRLIKDGSGRYIKMVVDGDVDEFVHERIKALAGQLK